MHIMWFLWADSLPAGTIISWTKGTRKPKNNLTSDLFSKHFLSNSFWHAPSLKLGKVSSPFNSTAIISLINIVSRSNYEERIQDEFIKWIKAIMNVSANSFFIFSTQIIKIHNRSNQIQTDEVTSMSWNYEAREAEMRGRVCGSRQSQRSQWVTLNKLRLRLTLFQSGNVSRLQLSKEQKLLVPYHMSSGR